MIFDCVKEKNDNQSNILLGWSEFSTLHLASTKKLHVTHVNVTIDPKLNLHMF